MTIEKRNLAGSGEGRKLAVIAVRGSVLEVDEGWRLEEEFLATREGDVIVDLTDCPYINSVGIGALVRGYTQAARSGRLFRLAGLNKRLRELLSITKLITVFELYDTVEEAAADPIPS